VLSVAGINERGCYNSNLLLVETERAMINAAEQLIIVADSTKFGHTSLALSCDLTEIDILVTDSDVTSEWKERLARAEIQLVVAESMSNEQQKSA
jgi:DeoR/GlpR family transcriptional regulator of sugar metabolism